jgi:hypothetical protein
LASPGIIGGPEASFSALTRRIFRNSYVIALENPELGPFQTMVRGQIGLADGHSG